MLADDHLRAIGDIWRCEANAPFATFVSTAAAKISAAREQDCGTSMLRFIHGVQSESNTRLGLCTEDCRLQECSTSWR
jgi:hypothetical protein